jgi:predicted membrane metal-binding protein
LALKYNAFSVFIGTMTQVLTISGQHVAVLAAVIYFCLRTFAVPAAPRILTTLALM